MTPITKLTFVVRTYECDMYGHVNNAIYMNYLEYARLDFLNKLKLDYFGLQNAGFGIWVVDAHLVFKAPALPDEEITVETQPAEVGNFSVLMGQKIYKADGTLSLEAQIKLAVVGPQGKPTKMPGDWKETLLGNKEP